MLEYIHIKYTVHIMNNQYWRLVDTRLGAQVYQSPTGESLAVIQSVRNPSLIEFYTVGYIKDGTIHTNRVESVSTDLVGVLNQAQAFVIQVTQKVG